LARSKPPTLRAISRSYWILEWLRFSGGLVFIAFGVVPIAIAAGHAYREGQEAQSSAAL